MTQSPNGVVGNVLDYNIPVSEFYLHSRYYVHFPTNSNAKRITFFIYRLRVK